MKEEEEEEDNADEEGRGASATKIRERLLDPRGASRQQSSECGKQEKALRNIDLMPQPEPRKMRALDYMRSISHPYRTLSPSACTLCRTREGSIFVCVFAENQQINMIEQHEYIQHTKHPPIKGS